MKQRVGPAWTIASASFARFDEEAGPDALALSFRNAGHAAMAQRPMGMVVAALSGKILADALAKFLKGGAVPRHVCLLLCPVFSRHSRVGGNPVLIVFPLDSRFRGNDKSFSYPHRHRVDVVVHKIPFPAFVGVLA